MVALHRSPPPAWMASMPTGWQDVRLKDVVHLPRVSKLGEPRLYAGLEHVQALTGVASPVPLDEDVSTFNVVAPGTICFGKLRPYLAKVFMAGDTLAVSTEFLPMIPTPAVDPMFLCFLLLSKGFIDHISDEVAGAKMPRVDWGILSSRRIPLPPKPVQAQIVRDLKFKLISVDRQLELLSLRREAVSEIKKSLREEVLLTHPSRNPGGLDAPAWHGEVPKGWHLDRIGHLFKQVAIFGGEGLPVLSVSIHRGISDKELVDGEQDRKVARSENRGKYKRVRPDDIVYNQMRAWQGGFGVSRVDGLVSPAYVVSRPRRKVEPRFIEHMLRTSSGVEEMRRRSRGIIDFRLRLYWDEFKDIRIPLPPLAEQIRLSDELDRRLKAIDLQDEAIVEMAKLVTEQRRALIHEAVTGLSNAAPSSRSPKIGRHLAAA
ncbi:restriction endonuclease subunit S [Janthinobacterium sp. EB271-G4-7A]|uniref:restriction endonuclease subunit S n=1 Tax=Janthinobacterium sp. EB271-G4-7A TaxID=2775056 RepID=UPI001E625AF2|nr:restriction endonuclease subunit S [Janthinobacterium sp. EB271-G4-7A]MCC7697097.1 restriction endonuclease subunit S [Janthinobacterium sp. EB271-G4-7A]